MTTKKEQRFWTNSTILIFLFVVILLFGMNIYLLVRLFGYTSNVISSSIDSNKPYASDLAELETIEFYPPNIGNDYNWLELDCKTKAFEQIYSGSDITYNNVNNIIILENRNITLKTWELCDLLEQYPK